MKKNCILTWKRMRLREWEVCLGRLNFTALIFNDRFRLWSWIILFKISYWCCGILEFSTPFDKRLFFVCSGLIHSFHQTRKYLWKDIWATKRSRRQVCWLHTDLISFITFILKCKWNPWNFETMYFDYSSRKRYDEWPWP